jgi:ATP-dependent DNA helicase RecG
MALELTSDVKFVKGIGPRNAQALAEKTIATVEDLLYYLPFRYEDRMNPRTVAELRPGEMASVIAEVRSSILYRTRKMPIFEVVFGQGRASLKALWFHGAYLKDRFKPGMMVALYGKVDASPKSRSLQIIQPQYEILSGGFGEGDEADEVDRKAEASLEIGRIVPIYHSADSQRLTSRWFRNVVHRALENLTPQIADGIPTAIRKRRELMDRRPAFANAHFPVTGENLAALQDARTPAHRRLIFEELFFLEVGLELKRRRMRQRPGIAFALDEKVRDAIKRFLPFKPTNAQKRVLKEIAEDMQQPTPMRRLLQGDVGSGKTLVAFQAAVIAIENGHQVAMMAPTEILATQHYLNARRLMEPLGYRVVLLTGSLETDRKRAIRKHIATGAAQLVIGTHALIEEKVDFAKLGLVIVDEQHRFGVMQRFRLMKKAADLEPDTLVMTATPIPRTLALTLYGDLDTSILDELPPGRTPVVTRRLGDERSLEVWDFVRKQVKAGHQAYVVYPVIEGAPEEDEQATLGLPPEEAGKGKSKLGLKAAVQMYDELRAKIFPDLRVGLLHGRMEAEEKETIMRRFQAGELQVLVSTTVIEVGVDVPNANIMVIEHAERFGLSQLHQLRGRVGRGAAKSYCVLMTGGSAAPGKKAQLQMQLTKITPEAEERLSTMVKTQDGFEIAETDLKLRGPGEFFGTRQAGMPEFRVANLLRDRPLLEEAKQEAAMVVNGNDPEISKEETATVMNHLKLHWQRRYGLVEVG